MNKTYYTSGIYQIKRIRSKRVYIGSSQNISKRWSEHKYKLRKGIHQNPKLQNAWNKYGEAKFRFTVLEECSLDKLFEREQYYFDQCDDRYNCVPIAGSTRGHKLSDKTRAKMSASRLGHTTSEETKAKISAGNKGNQKKLGWVTPDAVKEKIRSAQAGRPLTEAHVAALRAKRIEMKAEQTHCYKGHELTPENIYVWAKRPGSRFCRTCRNETTLRYYHKTKVTA